MATYNVVRSKHATLIASTVDTVNFSDTPMYCITVVNRSASNTIFWRLDGTDPTAAGGDDNYLTVPNSSTLVLLAEEITNVRLISSGAQNYSVIVAPSYVHVVL
jgi:hypothetical protein